MDCNEYQNCYEILELPGEATEAEVRKAYFFLKELYSSSSIVTIPLENEISAEKKNRIIEDIEDAYRTLAGEMKQNSLPVESRPQVTVECDNFSGQMLRQIREQLNIDLRDVALATNIQAQYLEDIESENYASLPVYVYTRGYVINYAKYLRLDHQKVTADYMSRFTAWNRGN